MLIYKIDFWLDSIFLFSSTVMKVYSKMITTKMKKRIFENDDHFERETFNNHKSVQNTLSIEIKLEHIIQNSFVHKDAYCISAELFL